MPADDAQDRRVLAVSRAMDEAAQPSALLLACGEMTAQEMCTAKAVAHLMTRVALDALHAPATPDDHEAERVRAAEEMRERCALVAEEGHYGVGYGPAGMLALKDGLRAVKIWAHGDGDGIAAAIRALPIPEATRLAEDGWRTMESAPREPDYYADLPGDALRGVGNATSVETGDTLFLLWFEQFGPGYSKATHWRPLPPPPRALSAGPGGGDA